MAANRAVNKYDVFGENNGSRFIHIFVSKRDQPIIKLFVFSKGIPVVGVNNVKNNIRKINDHS